MIFVRLSCPGTKWYVATARDPQKVRDQEKWWNNCFSLRSSTGVANQSESHISYCITANSHITHISTREHHPISSSFTHVPLLS